MLDRFRDQQFSFDGESFVMSTNNNSHKKHTGLISDDKKEKIKKEFMSVTDYDEFDIRRYEFSCLGCEDRDVTNHLREILDIDSSSKTSNDTLEDEYPADYFYQTLGELERECAAEIASDHLAAIREENDIYESDEKLAEYKIQVNQYVEIIKKIRSEGDNTLISIFKTEEYKDTIKENVSKKMKNKK